MGRRERGMERRRSNERGNLRAALIRRASRWMGFRWCKWWWSWGFATPSLIVGDGFLVAPWYGNGHIQGWSIACEMSISAGGLQDPRTPWRRGDPAAHYSYPHFATPSEWCCSVPSTPSSRSTFPRSLLHRRPPSPLNALPTTRSRTGLPSLFSSRPQI